MRTSILCLAFYTCSFLLTLSLLLLTWDRLIQSLLVLCGDAIEGMDGFEGIELNVMFLSWYFICEQGIECPSTWAPWVCAECEFLRAGVYSRRVFLEGRKTLFIYTLHVSLLLRSREWVIFFPRGPSLKDVFRFCAVSRSYLVCRRFSLFNSVEYM